MKTILSLMLALVVAEARPGLAAVSWQTTAAPGVDLKALGIPADQVRLIDRIRCYDPKDPHLFEASEGARIETILGRPARVAGVLKFSWMLWRGIKTATSHRCLRTRACTPCN